jgi:hypothetical protein
MATTLSSRGVIYQIDFETSVNRLYVESFAPFYTPKRYKKTSGASDTLHFANAILFCQRN